MSAESWAVEYENDVGPNDEGFWEWYQVGPCKVSIPRRDDAARKKAEQVAHLISAVPEMLAALKRCAITLPIGDGLLNDIDAAIAKAEGK